MIIGQYTVSPRHLIGAAYEKKRNKYIFRIERIIGESILIDTMETKDKEECEKWLKQAEQGIAKIELTPAIATMDISPDEYEEDFEEMRKIGFKIEEK